MLAQPQGHRHRLLAHISRGNHILQIHPAGEAGLPDETQEALKIALFQAGNLLRHPAVFVVFVHSPHNRPIAAGFPEFGDGGVKFLLRNFRGHFSAQAIADFLQLSGNGRVFIGQVGVICPGVDDAQGMAGGGEIEVHRPDVRVSLVRKINGHQAAHRAGGLIHQAAGLAEEHILRILADLSHLGLGHPAGKEQMIDDGADEHLKGRGGAQTGAGQHRGLAVGVKAPNLAAQLGEPSRHAPDEGRRRVDLRRHRLQIVQIHLTQRVALGLDTNHVCPADTDSRHRVQVYRAGQHPTPLMIRVIAADFRASGSGKIPLGFPAEGGGKAGIQSRFVLCGKNQVRHNILQTIARRLSYLYISAAFHYTRKVRKMEVPISLSPACFCPKKENEKKRKNCLTFSGCVL